MRLVVVASWRRSGFGCLIRHQHFFCSRHRCWRGCRRGCGLKGGQSWRNRRSLRRRRTRQAQWCAPGNHLCRRPWRRWRHQQLNSRHGTNDRGFGGSCTVGARGWVVWLALKTSLALLSLSLKVALPLALLGQERSSLLRKDLIRLRQHRFIVSPRTGGGAALRV